MKIIKTAEGLREKYNKDLEELQDTCKHIDKSEWMIEEWPPAHTTGWEVIQCNTCWKLLERKSKCNRCGKSIHINEDEYIKLTYEDPIRNGLCSEKCRKEYFSDVIG